MNTYEKIRTVLMHSQLSLATGIGAEALAALAELEKAAAEPVAWQYRLDGDCEWSQCTMRGFDTLVSIGECETRQLYTTPPPAKPAPVTPEQTLSALTAHKAQQGDEFVKMQAAGGSK